MLYWCNCLFVDYKTILQGILKNRSAVLRPVDSQLGKEQLFTSAGFHISTVPMTVVNLTKSLSPWSILQAASTKPSLRSVSARASSLDSRLISASGQSDSCCLKVSAWKVLHLSSFTLTTSLYLAFNSPWAKGSVESPPSLLCSTVVDNRPEYC